MAYSLSVEEELLIKTWNDHDFDFDISPTESPPPPPPPTPAQQQSASGPTNSENLFDLPRYQVHALLANQLKIGVPKNREEFELIGM